MKTCSACHERVSPDEGSINEDGKFVCFPCADEAEQAGDKGLCPECGESSEEFEKEGVCPECGFEAEKDAENEEEA